MKEDFVLRHLAWERQSEKAFERRLKPERRLVAPNAGDIIKYNAEKERIEE